MYLIRLGSLLCKVNAMNPLLIFNTYKNLIILVAFGLLLIFAGIQSYRLNSAKYELSVANSQTYILSAAIKSQNINIEKLATDSAKRTQDAFKALKDAQVVSLHQRDKINALKTLVGKVKTCDAAVDSAKGIL